MKAALSAHVKVEGAWLGGHVYCHQSFLCNPMTVFHSFHFTDPALSSKRDLFSYSQPPLFIPNMCPFGKGKQDSDRKQALHAGSPRHFQLKGSQWGGDMKDPNLEICCWTQQTRLTLA